MAFLDEKKVLRAWTKAIGPFDELDLFRFKRAFPLLLAHVLQRAGVQPPHRPARESLLFHHPSVHSSRRRPMTFCTWTRAYNSHRSSTTTLPSTAQKKSLRDCLLTPPTLPAPWVSRISTAWACSLQRSRIQRSRIQRRTWLSNLLPLARK